MIVVVVTGGSGFLGRHVVDGNVLYTGLVSATVEQADAVVHLAAVVRPDS